MSKYSNIIKNSFQKWRNTARDTKRLLHLPQKNQKMTKHVISQKQSYVIKKPKSARKILQNKFKPIKNIKLQNIFTKNLKNPSLAHPLLDTLRPARETKQRSPNREAVYSFYLMVLLINKQSQTHYGFLTTNIFIHNTF